MELIIPPNFYVADELASPPLQFEPFYNIGRFGLTHLKRGCSLASIPEDEIYGISAYTCDIKMADKIAYFLKERNPECKIAIGGYHATYRPKEIDQIYDYVVSGPGESFIQSVAENNFPAERQIRNTVRIDEFSQRSYNFFSTYFKDCYTIRLSYGCPGKCSFCVRSPVVFRDFDDILSQIIFLYESGFRSVRIIDDICTEHPNFSDICRALGLFKWSAQTRLDKLTADKAALMKGTGCELVQVGVESFSEQVRNKLNKNLSDQKLFDGIAIAHDNGLKLNCFLMFGTPSDTYDTMEYTREVSYNVLSEGEAKPLVFVPFPGTLIGDNPEKYGLNILTDEYEYYSTICFQNRRGRIVSVPGSVKDVSKWEELIKNTVYELNSWDIRAILNNPITDWHDNYERVVKEKRTA